MKTKPSVSVIIPTYNRSYVLEKAIQSVLAQTYTDYELIVVDDGSTDDTARLVCAYPQITYIRKPHGGQGSARTAGLLHAQGRMVASLDSDDCWHPAFLEQTVALLEHSKLDFVFAGWIQQRRDGSEEEFCRRDPFLRPYFAEGGQPSLMGPEELRYLYLRDCPSPSSSLLIRRSSMVSVWDNRFHIADDWNLLLDMVFRSNVRAGFIKTPLWRKTVQQDNVYDGRPWPEVVNLLHIEDALSMLRRHHAYLRPHERRFLQLKYLRSLYRSAKFNIKKEGGWCAALQRCWHIALFYPAFYFRQWFRLDMLAMTVKGDLNPHPQHVR